MDTNPINPEQQGQKSSTASGSDPSNLVDDKAAFKTIGDRYEMVRQIGRGGMAVVYLAQDKKLNRYVACKRLLLENVNRNSIQRRFLKEAQTIASLGHIHIVNIFDIGKDELGYYITMEYVPGPHISDESGQVSPPPPVNLLQYVTETGPLECNVACEIVVKMCSALEYAHHQGIVHRDVKPSNILLDDRYAPKLVDFGLARPVSRSDKTEITLEGEFLGTPEYIAPEQWSDAGEVDKRVDIYALGGVLWFMLTGKLPRYFREADVPSEIRQPLAKALAHKRTDRFSTIQDFAAELKKHGPSTSSSQKSAAKDDPSTSGKWPCPNCECLNQLESKYCIKCGTYGMQACPVCENEVRVGVQHCPNCGIDIEQAEEAAGIIAEAENFAAFMEYETAVNRIKDLDNNHFPKASDLAKEWRQIALNRRNLLTDLESCLRVYNIEQAVEIHKQLRETVPEESLSDSIDFDVVVKFSSLDAELKNQLKEAATRAQDDYDLDKLSHFIDYLNEVCGADACMTINTELGDISTHLDNLVTKAGLAIGMNCLSRGMDMLMSASPWRGSELGERRNRMISRCKELIQEREKIIDTLEESVRTGDFTGALQVLHKTVNFRLPPNYSEMEPDDDDLAANDRIVQVDKILAKKFQEKIPQWVEQNNWDEIKKAFTVFREEEDSNWQELNEKLQGRVNKKIANFYNTAVEAETKGRIVHAEKSWKLFLKVPQELIPPHLWQYAENFGQRKKVFLQSKRNRLISRIMMVTLISWVYPLLLKVFPTIVSFYTQDKLNTQSFMKLVPGIANFLIFILICAIVLSKKMAKAELQRNSDFNSARFNLLFFLIACSPVSYIYYQIVTWILANYPITVPGWFPFISIALVWLFVDLLRRYYWRIPGLWSLCLGWIVIFGINSFLTLGPGYQLWPIVALLHGIVFLFFTIPGYTISARKNA